jgi:putative DNA primase/helicase
MAAFPRTGQRWRSFPFRTQLVCGLSGSANGTILNLRTDTEAADRSIVTKKLGASAERNATCPVWLNFLDQIFEGDQELIAFLQRAVGYTLTGSVEEQCLFILIGAGANGKSTLLRTLQRLFGDYAASIPMQSLMDQKHGSQQTNDLAYLVGKRLVTASEGERGQRLAESKIKLMTGGDRIVCRQLYREYFEFQPQLKLWLATNNLPTISGTDEAIWRRIMVVPFGVTFAQEQQDKSLGSRLAEELPGILNWAIEGCIQWRDDGLSPPSQVVQSTRGYRAESDTVGQWIEAACVQEPRRRTSMKVLYESYRSWCDNGGLEALSNSCFGKELTRRGFENRRASAGNERLGIGIKKPDRQEELA